MTQTSTNQNSHNNNHSNGFVDKGVSIEENSPLETPNTDTKEPQILAIETEVTLPTESSRQQQGATPPPWQILTQWWHSLTLRSKSIMAATAIGVTPVVIVGSLAYGISNQITIRQTKQAEISYAVDLTNKVSLFMVDRYFDIQTLSNL